MSSARGEFCLRRGLVIHFLGLRSQAGRRSAEGSMTNWRYLNKVVVITGGSRDIGYEGDLAGAGEVVPQEFHTMSSGGRIRFSAFITGDFPLMSSINLRAACSPISVRDHETVVSGTRSISL